MNPYILIILINMQVATIEFPDASSCFQAQREVAEQLSDMKEAGATCFKKLGSHEKQS